MLYYAGHTPYSQAPQIQELPGFSGQLTVPQPQMQHNAPSAPRQVPVMENLLQIPGQPFQPLNQALSQFAQMLSQEKQTPQTSFQSSQQAFSQLQQQLHMEQPCNYIDCATAPSWFETESTLITGGEQFQQNYIDNSDDSSWMQSPIFQETSFNSTMETPCCCDCQLDEIHGFEQAGQTSLLFDHCITGFELPATENDSFGTGVELTLNQFDTSSTGLDYEFEFSPTDYSPPNSCFSDTSMPVGEEGEFDVLLQQFQQTAPTLDFFNPDCSLTDTLGFPSDVRLH